MNIVDSLTDKVINWLQSTKGALHTLDQKNRSVLIKDLDVNTILKPVATFDVSNNDVIGINMEVLVNALAKFEIRYKYSSDIDAPYLTKALVTADWTTPNYPILETTGDFTLAIVSNVHTMLIDTRGVNSVQLWASSSNAAGSELIFNGNN